MPLPANNSSFELGNLTGYKSEGRCLVATSFHVPTANLNIHAHSGQFFAVIDDPVMIDEDGVRIPGPPNPIDTRSYRTLGSDGKHTIGVDGARLSAEDVPLAKGQSVRFWWAFAGNDRRLGCNDFALFEIVDAGSGDLIYQRWLCDVRLGTPESGYLPWRAHQYTSDSDRRVHLRWVASNGRLTTNPSGPPQAFQRAYPAALLLDAIAIA
jgi:hypothetical protein